MKKVICTTLCLFFLFSCSTSNNDVETSSQSLKIENDLKLYNEGLEGYSSSGMPKKGKFWKVMAVIGADALGGAVGGLVGSLFGPAGAAAVGGATAAGASKAASGIAAGGNGGSDGGTLEPINENFNVEYNVPDQYGSNDIGSHHNAFLEHVYSGNVNMDDYIAENYGQEMVQNYNSGEVQNANELMIQSTVTYMEMDYDYSYLLNTYKDNGLISENTQMVMSLFMEALFQASSDNEISQILNYYSQTVLQSDELTQSDKRSIFSAFSVARSSSNYWNNLEN